MRIAERLGQSYAESKAFKPASEGLEEAYSVVAAGTTARRYMKFNKQPPAPRPGPNASHGGGRPGGAKRWAIGGHKGAAATPLLSMGSANTPGMANSGTHSSNVHGAASGLSVHHGV
jgi:hypothetical protein